MINKQYYVTQDSYVRNTSPTGNFSWDYLNFGYVSSASWYSETFLKSSTILTNSSTPVGFNCDLHTYMTAVNNGTKDVVEITSSWTDTTVTWNTKPSYSTVILNEVTIPVSSREWYSWDVTSTCLKWIIGTLANNGLCFKPGLTLGTYSTSMSDENDNGVFGAKTKPYFLMNGTFGTESTSYKPLNDTYIDQANATTNYSTATSCIMGEDSGGKDKLYLFNIDNSVISSIDNLYQAQIRLYVTAESVEDNQVIEIYKIISSWTHSSITWNTRPTFIKVGEYYVGTNTGQLNPTTDSFLSIDITDIIQGWIDGEINYGIGIFHNGTTSDEITFNSTNNISNTPYLYLDHDSNVTVVEPPSAIATATMTAPTQSNNISVPSVTSIATFENPSLISKIIAMPMIANAIHATPILKGSVLIEPESAISISIFKENMILGGVLAEFEPFISNSTFSIPTIISSLIVLAEPMISSSIASIPTTSLSEYINVDEDSWLDSRVGNEGDTHANDLTLDLYYESSTPTTYPILKINDLSSYVGKSISNAILNIYITSQNRLDELSQITIDIVDSTWTESTVSWTNKPTYGSIKLASTPVPTGVTGWYEIDITEIFQDWVDTANYGLIMYGSV